MIVLLFKRFVRKIVRGKDIMYLVLLGLNFDRFNFMFCLYYLVVFYYFKFFFIIFCYVKFIMLW